jgi:hypothetical protein
MLQGLVMELILALLATVRVFFRSRDDLALEILALRQQVAVLKCRRPRPRLNSLDRLFWTTLRRAWTRWTEVLVIVKPETVVGWHRAGFWLHWRWRSRASGGRPKLSAEVSSDLVVATDSLIFSPDCPLSSVLGLGARNSDNCSARYYAQ